MKLAGQLNDEDWLPIAQGVPEYGEPSLRSSVVLTAMVAGELSNRDVLVRVGEADRRKIATSPVDVRRRALTYGKQRVANRFFDVKKNGTLRLEEAGGFRLGLDGAMAGTAKNGTYVPFDIALDERFWLVAGLYIAEGHCTVDGAHERHRLQWSFHPEDEPELVATVADYWESVGVKTTVRRLETAMAVSLSSKLLGRWWLDGLGMASNCYRQRIPDLAWAQGQREKRALLRGLWLGDGSWNLINGGPSVQLQYGTVSRELADGIQRLLGELGIVARLRVGRTAKSTVDTYWLTISGADQVERSTFLVHERHRDEILRSIARQRKRIAPTGYRRFEGTAWVRVTQTKRRRYGGSVYSLEVPGAETFVTTGGLVVHNCFPKDVSALKILAGNSGYHFQLLNSVIEVNELQKRRVMSKLEKHLGSLVGKRVALLGLAFKPNTDDMREASSLVLAARLQGAGAQVAGFDPVAEEEARKLIQGVDFADSALDAVEGADAVVLVTEWDEFIGLDWAAVAAAMRGSVVIDGRNALDREAVEAAGLSYEGIGR